MRALLVTILLTLAPACALAHSEMQETLPVDGAVLSEMPEEIAFNFSDKLRLTSVIARHAGGEEQKVDLEAYGKFDTSFTLPLAPMGSGVYEVEWRGLGLDGHAMTGEFSFEVE